jgi:hypothetical protein
MITGLQLTRLIPILEAQGFRWENSDSMKAVFTNGDYPHRYDLIIYLETEMPLAEVNADGKPYRRFETMDFAELETKIKLGVI